MRAIIGGAHPLEKSASGFEVQAYIAYLRGIDVLRTSPAGNQGLPSLFITFNTNLAHLEDVPTPLTLDTCGAM